MLLGCIADDFTGASDLANVLTRSGLCTVQFNGIPHKDARDCEAGIVSLKTRSIGASEAVHQSLSALEWLKSQGCRQFLFKYCSTFDSTRLGNIGPVAEALLDALTAEAAIVCPAFPTLGRSIYSGHLFVGTDLLNNSGMEHHPLNPMTDANLVRWLGYQTQAPVGLLGMEIVSQGSAAVRDAVHRLVDKGVRLIVCDCIADDDLTVLGAAVADMPLVTGGSGIALGLSQNFHLYREIPERGIQFVAPTGPALALAGSCSEATRRQIAVHLREAPALKINVDDIMMSRTSPQEAWGWVREQSPNALPLVYSSAEPSEVKAAQDRHGVSAVAAAMEGFFGALARCAVRNGVRKLIVAGGETSSAVVTALELESMWIGPEIDPGVPVLIADRTTPLALALKSGNFGAPDFFRKAVATMELGRP